MKTFFTLLLCFFFAASAFAHDEGRISISLFTNDVREVQVVVDGRVYEQRESAILLEDVQPGQHRIQVYRVRRNDRSPVFGNSRVGRASRNELLYSSTVYVRPNYHVDIMINRFGKALVDEAPITEAYNRTDSRYDDRTNNNGYYNQAISEGAFNQLVRKINNQWSSGAKVNSAKEAFASYYFTTQQVRQLLQLFNAESDKLEVAKQAYRSTVDQRNYTQLYDVFVFQSSREELDRYVRGWRD